MASDAFDPYHKWLGIPPKDQPANHYRLLGLELFESDLDVIEHAADQRQLHVRSFQNGPHKVDSQKILNEISSAKLCLLSPAKKSAYDKALRARLKPVSIVKAKALPSTAIAPNHEIEKATQLDAPADIFSQLPTTNVPVLETKRPLRKNSSQLLTWCIAAGSGVILLAAFLIWLNLSGEQHTPTVAQANDSENSLRKFEESVSQLPTKKAEQEKVILPPTPPPKPTTTISNDAAPTITPLPTETNKGISASATDVPQSKSNNLVHKIEFTRWNNGQPATQPMSLQTTHFVGITEVLGKFLGDGERFSVRDDKSGRWVLNCSAAMGIQVTAAETESPWRTLFEDKVEIVRWNRNQSEKIKLIHQHDGFALFSGATGCFIGSEHQVRVSLDDDGHWYLSGKSNLNTQGEALVFRYKKPGKLRVHVDQIKWQRGSPAQRLIQRDSGLCYLSGIGGGFHGGGERAACDLTQDGFWNLAGSSGQNSMVFWVTTIEFNDPSVLALLRAAKPQTNITGKRAPLPEPALLDAARAKLASDLSNSKAEDMLQLGLEKNRDLEERHVLLVEAKKLAVELGNCAVALSAVDELTAVFDIDPYATTLQTLQDLKPHCSTSETNRDLCVAAMRQAELAIREQQSATVTPLLELAFAAARKCDTELVRRATRLLLDVRRKTTASTPIPDMKP